jgi:hypothetical protein
MVTAVKPTKTPCLESVPNTTNGGDHAGICGVPAHSLYEAAEAGRSEKNKKSGHTQPSSDAKLNRRLKRLKNASKALSKANHDGAEQVHSEMLSGGLLSSPRKAQGRNSNPTSNIDKLEKASDRSRVKIT